MSVFSMDFGAGMEWLRSVAIFLLNFVYHTKMKVREQ